MSCANCGAPESSNSNQIIITNNCDYCSKRVLDVSIYGYTYKTFKFRPIDKKKYISDLFIEYQELDAFGNVLNKTCFRYSVGFYNEDSHPTNKASELTTSIKITLLKVVFKDIIEVPNTAYEKYPYRRQEIFLHIVFYGFLLFGLGLISFQLYKHFIK